MRATPGSIATRVALAVLSATALAGAAPARTELPQVSSDGLQLQKGVEGFAAVYLAPGAHFGGYDKVAILDCYVAFRKNWLRDQNEDREIIVTDADMDRIKKQLAAGFEKIFAQELTKAGETVVTTAAKDVLVLRPAIVNLDITAPDDMTPDVVSISRQGGQMTLYLELYDSVTNSLLGRVIDTQPIGESDMIEIRSRVMNSADIEQVLDRWAKRLGQLLDQARKAAAAGPPGQPSHPKSD